LASKRGPGRREASPVALPRRPRRGLRRRHHLSAASDRLSAQRRIRRFEGWL